MTPMQLGQTQEISLLILDSRLKKINSGVYQSWGNINADVYENEMTHENN